MTEDELYACLDRFLENKEYTPKETHEILSYFVGEIETILDALSETIRLDGGEL